MGNGIKVEGRNNGGHGFSDFAFNKRGMRKALGNSKERSIEREGERSNHGMNGSNRAKGGGGGGDE